MKMRISYNAPVILTFSLICLIITAIDQLMFERFAESYFMVADPYIKWTNPLTYYHFFTHAFGHANWGHFFGNMSFILLIGPIMEEKYGSKQMTLMILMTATITGILHTILFNGGLLGASGIVFMLIVLVSITDVRKGSIPLSFILVMLLFVGKEFINATQINNVSEFGHILGGVCGAIFGFTFSEKKQLASKDYKHESEAKTTF